MGSLRSLRGPEERDVNPPFRDATRTPEGPWPGPARPEPAPDRPVATAEEQGAVEELPADERAPDPAEHAPEAAEPAPSGAPAPVHVPYATTGVEPDVVSTPPIRGAPRRPARSPFWAAVRSHLWLVAIVLVLVGGAGTAYWGLRVHQRIGATTLERGITDREHATTVRCVEQQSNGAVWACGLVYRAESVCLIANVNPAGDWTTKPGTDLCTHRPALTALLPARIASAEVEADLRTQLSLNVSKCAKIATRKVRWACLVPGASSTSCLEVRIVPWVPWGTDPSTACPHVPALRKFLGEAT
jgi:hypothetical protein